VRMGVVGPYVCAGVLGSRSSTDRGGRVGRWRATPAIT
jgi:hypothetical protein